MALRDPVRHNLTYEDYLLFPEDGNRHEILDGEHFVTAAPNLLHQSIVVELTSWIAPFVRRHPLGRLYVAPADVLLGEHDVVQPDLLFVSQARARILTEINVQGAPDLVIEVLSPSTRRRDEVSSWNATSFSESRSTGWSIRRGPRPASTAGRESGSRPSRS